MRHHHRRHNHFAEHHTFCHPHFRSAEFHGSHFHGHRHPGRGLHWVGLAVLATTFVRKGKGEPVFWFGLGALVTGLFMKHRASLENAWSHRCRSGRSGDDAKKRSFSWRLTVVGDDANEGRAHHSCRVHDTCRGGVSSPATDDDMCSCGYVEAKDATQVETLFDATNDTEASEDGDLLHPAPREPKAGEAAPIAAQQPTPTVESRIDTLARAVEEIRTHISQLGGAPSSRRSSTASSGLDVGAALADVREIEVSLPQSSGAPRE